MRVVMLVSTLLLGARSAVAQEATGPKVTFGGFLDAYFAYDFGRPATFDRAFTTQPARHNEFNVNLAHLEAKLEGNGIRARLALQAGTSVQSNYAAEPTVGAVSGPSLSRHLQEAVAGVRLGRTVWLDGGVYLSHIGSESWASRDNPTYTRSLIADYSPYYQAGAKVTWTPSGTVTAQLNVVNGWQIISENNTAKSVGFRVDYAAAPSVTLSAYNLIGNEIPSGAGGRTRWFQGASARVAPSVRSLVIATFDVGVQEGADGERSSTWYGGALIGRLQATPRVAVSARVERYADPDQVIIVTGGADGFRVWGGSVGLDVVTAERALWRTEFRGLRSSARIFPDRDGLGGLGRGNALLVTSLGVTF
ncbi:MAG: porin [Gemmatimonadales bacterium]